MDRRNQVAAGYRSVDPQAVDTGARWPGCGGHGSSSPGIPVDEPALDPRFGAVFGRRAWVLRWDVGGRQGRRGGAEPCVGSACKWCAGRTGSPGRRGTRGLWGSSAGCREWCWARASARAAVRGGFRASSAGFALGRRGTSGGRGPGEAMGDGAGRSGPKCSGATFSRHLSTVGPGGIARDVARTPDSPRPSGSQPRPGPRNRRTGRSARRNFPICGDIRSGVNEKPAGSNRDSCCILNQHHRVNPCGPALPGARHVQRSRRP